MGNELSVQVACAFKRRNAFQMRRLRSSNEPLGDGQPRVTAHGYAAIAPGLSSKPFDGIVTVVGFERTPPAEDMIGVSQTLWMLHKLFEERKGGEFD